MSSAAGRKKNMAELSGLSVRTIQRIERGQTPSMESLKAIALVFDVDFSNVRGPEMETTATLQPGIPVVHADETRDAEKAVTSKYRRRTGSDPEPDHEQLRDLNGSPPTCAMYPRTVLPNRLSAQP